MESVQSRANYLVRSKVAHSTQRWFKQWASNVSVHYIQHLQQFQQAEHYLRHQIESEKESVFGFDCEWIPTKNRTHRRPGVLQICTSKDCFVFHLTRIRASQKHLMNQTHDSKYLEFRDEEKEDCLATLMNGILSSDYKVFKTGIEIIEDSRTLQHSLLHTTDERGLPKRSINNSIRNVSDGFNNRLDLRNVAIMDRRLKSSVKSRCHPIGIQAAFQLRILRQIAHGCSSSKPRVNRHEKEMIQELLANGISGRLRGRLFSLELFAQELCGIELDKSPDRSAGVMKSFSDQKKKNEDTGDRGASMSKFEELVRDSRWTSADTLNADQISYAAMDALVSRGTLMSLMKRNDEFRSKRYPKMDHHRYDSEKDEMMLAEFVQYFPDLLDGHFSDHPRWYSECEKHLKQYVTSYSKLNRLVNQQGYPLFE